MRFKSVAFLWLWSLAALACDLDSEPILQDASGGEGGDGFLEDASSQEQEEDAEDPGKEDGSAFFLACESEEEGDLEGLIYIDKGQAANSEYDQASLPSRENAGTQTLSLFLDGENYVAKSCDDGSFRLVKGLPKPYFVTLQGEAVVSSRNNSLALSKGLQSGSLRFVVFGDSLPVMGGRETFPKRLDSMFNAVMETDVKNVAVSGSTSDEWLPRRAYFQERLLPHLKGTDVVIFSLGGNDLQDMVFDLLDASDVMSQLGEVQEAVDEVVRNLKEIIAEIHKVEPKADVLWMLYPNYATTELWRALIPSNLQFMAAELLGNTLADIRERMAEEDILLLDMLEVARGLDLDAYLWDELHLNNDGHALWADEIFRLLGGVQEGQGPLYREWGLLKD